MSIQVNGMFPGELYPDTILGGCIEIFENVWPNPEQTISEIEKECSTPESGLYWRKATTIGGGSEQKYRTNYDMAITSLAKETNNALAQNIHNQFYMILLASTIPYAQKHDISELHHEGYSMLRYGSGQEYKAHADGSYGNTRCISAICYLNDEYEGGEIEFVNFGIKIKPKPGMLVLFPSNYAYSHVAHPITGGTKYAIVTWIHDGPIRFSN
jgi:predicted 2-oxoglutarate/Fe(II)-dependent dioxygenase YbiX